MSTTLPRFGTTELEEGQALPATSVMELFRAVSQGAGHFIFKDRDLATPPGSPADGDCYLVAASPTGAWVGHAGEIAFYMSTAWIFIPPIEGFTAWVNDENVLIAYDGSSWVSFGGGAGSYQPLDSDLTAIAALTTASFGRSLLTATAISDLRALGLQVQAVPRTVSGTSDTAVLTDVGGYIRCTSASAVVATIPPNSSVAFPTGTVLTYEQAGSGTVTLTPGSGVTLNSRGGLLALGGQYAVAQVKKVATDTWTVIGDVA